MPPPRLLGRAAERLRGGATSGSPAVADVRVDDTGITARSAREVVLDVLVDGRRVFSYWLHRDGEERGREHHLGWPRQLQDFLNGTARFSIVVHESGERVFDQPVRLGSGEGAIEVVHPRTGQPLSLDKSWRRVVDFASADDVAPLMDAIQVVLDALREAGIEAFLAYGTLLGAVREGSSSATTATPTSATSAATPTPSTSSASRSGCSARSSASATGSLATPRSPSRWTSRRATAWSAASTCSAASSWTASCT